jgi:L-ectoine synthase
MMLIRTLDDLAPGKGRIRTPSWSSYRLLHRDDGMGVRLTDAVLEPGLDQVWWYKNHLEAVYCLEGEGVLEDLFTGKCYEITPGSLYALDKHERHRLRVTRRMRVICTFVPPLAGGEVHDADGSYDAG